MKPLPNTSRSRLDEAARAAGSSNALVAHAWPDFRPDSDVDVDLKTPGDFPPQLRGGVLSTVQTLYAAD